MPVRKTYLRRYVGFTPLDNSKSCTNTAENEAKLLIRTRLNSRRYLTGLTLIEIMIAILVLLVAVIGTTGYRYYSALDARKAQKETLAAKVALLLNESWRGIFGSTSYDPTDPTQLAGTGLIIQDSGTTGPSEPTGFTLYKKYSVTAGNGTLGNATFFVTMSYRDVDLDYPPQNKVSGSNHKRTALNTIVAWPVSTAETTYTSESFWWPFALTTYVETGIW